MPCQLLALHVALLHPCFIAFSAFARFPSRFGGESMLQASSCFTRLKPTQASKTPACCAVAPPPPGVRELLKKVPDEVAEKFYGCGSPTPNGIQGLRQACGGGPAPHGAAAGSGDAEIRTPHCSCERVPIACRRPARRLPWLLQGAGPGVRQRPRLLRVRWAGGGGG